jgi:hypothetical protein
MSRATKRVFAVIVVVTALGAISAPAASARFDLNPPNSNGSAQTSAVTIQSPKTTSSNGFDWGDAAIGAGAVFALLALGGGAVLISRRGQPRSRPATTS